MKPSVPVGLQSVHAGYNSLHGFIDSDWENNAGEFKWRIAVPPNTSAVIYIPAASLNDVTESGIELSKCEGIHSVKWEKGSAIIQVGSGKYQFKSKTK